MSITQKRKEVAILNSKTKEFYENKSALEELKIRLHDVNTFKEFFQQEILSKHIKTHTGDNNKVSILAYSVWFKILITLSLGITL